jgi:hypothetical protein
MIIKVHEGAEVHIDNVNLYDDKERAMKLLEQLVVKLGDNPVEICAMLLSTFAEPETFEDDDATAVYDIDIEV